MIESFGSNWRERLRSPLTWYAVGAVVLAVIPLVLAGLYVADRSFGISSGDSVLSGKRAQIASLNAQLVPLRGMAKEITDTRTAIDSFYSSRIPASYSQLTSSVGTIAMKSAVRLTQVSYTQGDPGSDLVEVSMEAGVNGSYRQVMRFVNGLERDRIFYVVRALSFAGQQGGSVSLRVRVSTWMRPGDAIHGQTESQPAKAATAALRHEAAFRSGGR
jgi:Tfp pilus assembly protein PilO